MAVLLAILHTWAAISANSMNADGINYLDMGDAYWRGDWNTAVNPVWSPLYAWLLGLMMRLVQPSMQWEFPLVHLINLGVFIVTLFCFEQFWRSLWQSQPEIVWPEWAWWGLGYTLFTWASLSLIAIWAVTPDMLMAALVLLAASLLLQMRLGATKRSVFALFGLVLGLSYLSKAIMLPMSIIFLFVGLLTAQRGRYILLSAAVFLLVSVPYIALISQVRGHFTWGDAGTITYVRYVNGLPYPHWQGGPPENGFPIHPSRQILADPPVYEFNGPIGGTYPISYDPVYWYKGVQSNFSWSQQIQALIRSTLFYLGIFGERLGAWLAIIILLYGMGRERFEIRKWGSMISSPRSQVSQWALIVPALAALGAYALVYVEERYVGVFVILLLGELLVKTPKVERRIVSLAGSVMIAFMLVNIIAFNLTGAVDLNANLNPEPVAAPAPHWPGATAETLRNLGVRPGDKVGVIGYGFESFWARLAGVQIVAEMLEWQADAFWSGDNTLQQEVLQAFADAGATAVVAEYVPSYTKLISGWQRVDQSSYYIYLLREEP